MECASSESIKDQKSEQKHEITVGSVLPYGPRMYHITNENLVRMKDIGINQKILVIGVLGSFTPECWNRHLLLVLKHYDYYLSMGVHNICCIATNDAFAHNAWGIYLGCSDKVLMWSDPTGKYTKAIGMDVVVPWLNGMIRSRRYVILAEDMVVTKIISTDEEISQTRWDCDHLLFSQEYEDEKDINQYNF